jgi:hypothetical protein
MSYRTALAALILFAAPLAAQDPSRVYLSTPRPDGGGFTVMPRGMMASHRGVIGVGVDLRPQPNDSIGATLTTVTPGSAAAGAGLVAGDIITKFDGTPLVERGRRMADDSDRPDQSAPGLRLLDLASRMSPGDTVAVEWKHERSRKTAQLVAQPAATVVYSGSGDAPDVRFFSNDGPGHFKFGFVTPDEPGRTEELQGRLQELQGRIERMREPLATMPGMGDQVFLRMGGPLGGVQFAPVNADLGKYFGTTDGILVLETPDSSAHIDLRGGDVILAIGDRKPANVEHLLRILGSYQDSEVVHFDVMRDHRRITIDAKAQDLQPEGRFNTLEFRTTPDQVMHGDETPRPTEPRRSRRPGA